MVQTISGSRKSSMTVIGLCGLRLSRLGELLDFAYFFPFVSYDRQQFNQVVYLKRLAQKVLDSRFDTLLFVVWHDAGR